MVEIFDPENVDFDEVHFLLKLSFEDRSKSRTNVAIPSAEALAHKYLNSEVKSKLALQFDNQSLVAMNGLTPVQVMSGDLSSTAWMSCDSATHPNFRGRGLFKQCVLALEHTLENNDLVFGFPNANSLPGFKKLGWEIKNEITLWISSKNFSESKRIRIEEIPMDSLGDCEISSPGIIKNKNYLNWRYSAKRDNYQAFRIWEYDAMFYVITKIMNVGSLKLTMVLENSLNSSGSIKAIKQISLSQQSHGILMSNSQFSKIDLIKNGYLPIPNKLNPRRIFLSGKFIGNKIRNSELQHWLLTLGDFDAL